MLKTVTALTAAGVIAAATMTVPNKAEANPAWLIPVIAVGAVGAVALGAAANANAYQPAGTVYVQPRAQASCHIVRERTASGWRRIEVCE
jgi:hypothetical protein